MFAVSLCAAFAIGCTKFQAPEFTDSSPGTLASDARSHQVVSLQLGQQPGAFQVEDVTGPAAGEFLCYRCKYSGKPTVVIFAREVNDSVTSLVQQIDRQVSENADQKLSAFMVVVGDNTDEVKPTLQRVQVAQHIKNTPLTVFNEKEGPAGYGLSPEAQIQVMMWNDDGLKVNRPLGPHLSKEEITEIVAQTKEILN
ncbi:hypothetical protein C5Y96_02000 [Blastopirellula marina]|uniref:Thioredoxin domain-containing protein n=2 Tax=Pirellulales TaxID=2691354 RepID=A0A2S8G2Z2_9BACT|nr:hypothetical protein C5Y96_02000 [Blastopirellula marina]RCS54988.1 hypothetical protein DTL36_02005 [Bremerella cremea]